ncbi:MAG: PAS domain-containing protein, partial [Acidobacteriota bacterium]|nr:PAS domain-containing protein [Acidobacteriota bacterium]
MTAISARHANAFGGQRDGLVGAAIGTLFASGREQVLIAQAQAKALAGDPVSFRLRRSAGEFEIFIGPLEDASGAITGAMGAAVSIAASGRLSGEEGDVEALDRVLEDQTLAGIFVAGADGVIEKCNSAFAEIFGFESTSAAVGSTVVDLYRDAIEFDRLLERLQLGRGVEMAEISGISITGRPLALLGNFLARFDEDNGLEHVSGFILDITERKVFEDQLIQSQRLEAVGQLAGGIAHDFNNLLTAVLGYVYLAQERLDAVHGSSRELTEIRKAAERAASLTHQLLTFARRQAARPQVLDLRQILSEIEGLIRSTVGEHTEVVILGDRGTWRVRVDPIQIEQALVNLAVNAHDAMPLGGRLTIELSEVDADATFARLHPDTRLTPGPYVCLTVSDTGSGMSA